MTATGPLATVVIPTHNRAVSLLATLGALAQQDCGPELFEVVVVPNGCTDDTVARLVDWPRSYRLRVVEIDAPGASAARNTGAEHARAPVLIFVDDDVVPSRRSCRRISRHTACVRANRWRRSMGVWRSATCLRSCRNPETASQSRCGPGGRRCSIAYGNPVIASRTPTC